MAVEAKKRQGFFAQARNFGAEFIAWGSAGYGAAIRPDTRVGPPLSAEDRRELGIPEPTKFWKEMMFPAGGDVFARDGALVRGSRRVLAAVGQAPSWIKDQTVGRMSKLIAARELDEPQVSPQRREQRVVVSDGAAVAQGVASQAELTAPNVIVAPEPRPIVRISSELRTAARAAAERYLALPPEMQREMTWEQLHEGRVGLPMSEDPEELLAIQTAFSVTAKALRTQDRAEVYA